MHKRSIILAVLLCIFSLLVHSQDSTLIYQNKAFTLTEVVVRNNFNAVSFIEYIKHDTTFYKAFKNLRVLSFSAYNDIRLRDKKGNTQASLISQTRQSYSNKCRTMQVVEEATTGDFYNRDGSYNYTSAEMYASLFFTKGTICNETNIVKGASFSGKGKSGMDKHKDQLKQLFFNPGNRIPGLPFIANKVALFDEDVSKLYDFKIDMQEYVDRLCYVFTIKPRENLTGSERSDIVIDEMTTWFDAKTLEITGRNYSLSYKAGVYDFDVDMEVQLTKIGDLWVPKVLRYRGEFDVIFKKKERALFTATLFNFKR